MSKKGQNHSNYLPNLSNFESKFQTRQNVLSNCPAPVESEMAEAALAEAAKATFSEFSGERDMETIGSSTGLGLIHSGYNDTEDDNLEDTPVTTASFNATRKDNLGKERALSALFATKGMDEAFEICCEIERDADGFKKPLPPKRNRRFAN